jgi:hypothetical protein
MTVVTEDPVTGDRISYQIDPDGAISRLSHPASFLRRDQAWDNQIMTTFCHFIHHFAGPESARQWTANRPGTFTITFGDALDLGRRHVIRSFGAALGRT